MASKSKNTEKDKSRKKKNLGVKIFVWFMFIAMLLGFIAPLISYLLITK